MRTDVFALRHIGIREEDLPQMLKTIHVDSVDQLISETQEFKNNTKTLSQDIVDIIKIIAGVAIAISGLTYLYLRDQQSDLTTKLGKAIIGIAIFLALIAVGEQIASS